jgi:hypothetical protein
MGQELWTSLITGYRRKGTRLSELRELVEDGITAHAILEPLKSSLADVPVEGVTQALKQRDFDVAGVKNEPNGRVVGWVTRESLKLGHVRDYMQPITTEQLIADGTPLPMLLKVLRRTLYTFVLVGPEVAGIVTRADLNKPPVRIYLFGLVSLLEMHLSFWVQAEYPDESWQSELSAGRFEAAKRIRDERRKRNQDPFLYQCLQFCDKRDLLVAKQTLREQLGLGTSAAALAFFKKAEDLRNVLAHSQQDLVDGSSWEDLIDIVQGIENVVQTSDQFVEEKARGIGGDYRDELWSAA